MAAKEMGGTIETVLKSPKAELPPATLEEARNQKGRPEKIQELTKRIEEHAGFYGELVWVLMMLEQWLQHHHPAWHVSDAACPELAVSMPYTRISAGVA